MKFTLEGNRLFALLDLAARAPKSRAEELWLSDLVDRVNSDMEQAKQEANSDQSTEKP